MPPDVPLNEAIVNDFVIWVERGSTFPKPIEPAGQLGTTPLDREALWSFLPRREIPLPKGRDSSWPRDPLDQFVLAQIEDAELTRIVTRIRRHSFDDFTLIWLVCNRQRRRSRILLPIARSINERRWGARR